MRCKPSFRIGKISMDFCCQKLWPEGGGASSLEPLSISAFTSKSMKALRTKACASPDKNTAQALLKCISCNHSACELRGSPPKLPRGHLNPFRRWHQTGLLRNPISLLTLLISLLPRRRSGFQRDLSPSIHACRPLICCALYGESKPSLIGLVFGPPDVTIVASLLRMIFYHRPSW